MQCEQAKLEIGAVPDALTPELTAHLAGCAACSAYRAETQVLDAHIRRAMLLAPPGLGAPDLGATGSVGASTASAIPVARRQVSRRVWALAASVLLASVAVLVLWPAQSAPALADELVEHVAHEDEAASWNNTEIVPQGTLDKVLRRAGVEVDTASLDRIVYAHSCWFHGRFVPHLVISTSQGPLTVIPLVGEQLAAEQRFIDSDYSGVLLPRPGGAIAVLARGRADVSIAAQLLGERIRLKP